MILTAKKPRAPENLHSVLAPEIFPAQKETWKAGRGGVSRKPDYIPDEDTLHLRDRMTALEKMRRR
jgi:hypothetical protein